MLFDALPYVRAVKIWREGSIEFSVDVAVAFGRRNAEGDARPAANGFENVVEDVAPAPREEPE